MNVKETEIGLIPEDWEVKRIDEISKVTDSLHQTPVYSDKGFPMVRVTDVKRGYLSLQDCLLVSDDIYKVFTKNYKPQKGDIVISRVGTYGVSSIVKTDEQFCLGQNTAIISPKINNDYLYYCLNSPSIKAQIDYLAVGSTHKTISLKSIKSIKIPVCSENEQKVIAATLSVLDDMIELNNQINKTLEEMAKAIFKSWFVDFEPFKDGEFEESELGLIPKGWRVVELGEITEEIRERVKDRKIPVFSAVKTGDLVLSEDYFTKQVFSRDISKYIVVKPFDFAYNPARINIGSIGINEFSYTGCVSPVYVVFRTDQKYKWFFKMLTRTERFKKEVNTRASGSVRQTLNFDEFSKIKVVYPYAEIVEEYNYIFEGLIMAKSKIEEEISILSEIRDTLLPKLMSGEIRVPVEEVI